MTRGDDLLPDHREQGSSLPGAPGSRPADGRSELGRGDLALLCFDDKEKLWVEIVRVEHDGSRIAYHGKLQSAPLVTKVKEDDLVLFDPRNVFEFKKAPTTPGGE
jgi:hypothetical protein